MQTAVAAQALSERRRAARVGLASLLADMQRRALALDAGGDFPSDDIDALRRLGLLAAPLPTALGGLGLGTQADAAQDTMDVLRLLGRGNLSVGRLYEAHVNALRLILRYGTPAQARRAANAAQEGNLFGLWVTDAPDAPLVVTEDGLLHGAKAPCSGAGHATRALLTARLPSGETRMLVVALLAGERADAGGWQAHGMRATANGHMALDGLHIGPDALIGAEGDYLRQPDFSAGAWRGSAVTLGGLEALVAELRRQLLARGRADDPHQRARVGEALIAQETARLWVRRAALVGESDEGDGLDIANTVNLARIAVENACLDAIRIVQRALGLAAFRRGALAELLFRDLATYLRQPAPDETLTEAAAQFMQREVPG
jgi:alkylation response protein AidB-like acyl-CoA dehydrogenase